MNELLLIEMMGELSPELLQDDYIEKDMRRGIISFFKQIFPFKKLSKKAYEFPIENSLTDESTSSDEYSNDFTETQEDNQLNIIQINDINDNNENAEIIDRGFSISIFEKKFRNLIKIISGITATTLVVIGIIIIIIRRHKSGVKAFEKKIQIIY